MNSLHEHIWSEFKATLDASPNKWDLTNIAVQDLDSFCRVMFQNYTDQYHSLRLTNVGFRVVSTLYQCWKIELPNDWSEIINRGSTLLAFHQKLKVPYYWDRKWFYVFHSEVAMEFLMVDNSFVNWIASF